MSQGDLLVHLTDMAGEPVRGRVEIELLPLPGEPGAGGDHMALAVNMGGATELTITGIPCRGGPGSLYRVQMQADHYRPYSFFQAIHEKRRNTASDDVEFWVKPTEVKNVRAPGYAELRPPWRRILESAQMLALSPEDQDLPGLAGEALYRKLGPLRKACFLNLARKAAHPGTAANCLTFVRALLLCRQDRFFAQVEAGMPEHLRQSPLYRSAPGTLHQPLPGYQLVEGSFKTRDAHANLQVTFMRHTSTGQLAADIDVDEATGLQHGLEVIRNAVSGGRTNPYLIREFLLAADPLEHTLYPGYGFSF